MAWLNGRNWNRKVGWHPRATFLSDARGFLRDSGHEKSTYRNSGFPYGSEAGCIPRRTIVVNSPAKPNSIRADCGDIAIIGFRIKEERCVS